MKFKHRKVTHGISGCGFFSETEGLPAKLHFLRRKLNVFFPPHLGLCKYHNCQANIYSVPTGRVIWRRFILSKCWFYRKKNRYLFATFFLVNSGSMYIAVKHTVRGLVHWHISITEKITWVAWRQSWVKHCVRMQYHALSKNIRTHLRLYFNKNSFLIEKKTDFFETKSPAGKSQKCQNLVFPSPKWTEDPMVPVVPKAMRIMRSWSQP